MEVQGKKISIAAYGLLRFLEEQPQPFDWSSVKPCMHPDSSYKIRSLITELKDAKLLTCKQLIHGNSFGEMVYWTYQYTGKDIESSPGRVIPGKGSKAS